MRTNYLPLLMGLGLLSSPCFSQNAFITGTTPIDVKAETLVYFGQNLELTSGADNGTTAVITNSGNIKVGGTYTNASATGDNFYNTWTDNTSYGQVIIADQVPAAGYLAMEKGVINSTAFSWGQFAIPFNFGSANAAMTTLFGVPYSNGGNRYYASMMVWNNEDEPRFDHLTSSSAINPTDYVILNLTYNSAGIKPIMDSNSKLTYRGIPSNIQHIPNQGSTAMYMPGTPWSTWKDMTNTYGEKFSTYIDDPLRNILTEDNYGKYIYEYGNPYTSNLNLAYIGMNSTEGYDDGVQIENLAGVGQINSANWVYGTGLTTSTMVKATYNGSNQWAGDPESLIVKPFEPFLIILSIPDEQPSITFTDGLKTFAMHVGADIDGNWPPFPLIGGKTNPNQSDNPVVQDGFYQDDFYQLRLKLYDEEGNETGNRVIIVVNGEVENEVPNSYEAEYFDFEGSGFYLAQERADGGHVTASQRKMDINAVNVDFVGKPIPMLFHRTEGDNTSYKIKAELFQGSIFNKLKNENENFNDGNTFFIYDNETDQLAEVKNGSVFNIEPIPLNGQKNRYEVYWNEGPTGKGMGTNDELASATIIYRDNDSHFVKFSDKWSSAEVKVYDMSGRNIMTFDKVDTKNNLEIKLASRGVYAVKIKSNTGEVYTQKIIK